MKKICIIGQGGHSNVIKDIITALGSFQIIACLDDKFTTIENREEIIYGPVSMAMELAADPGIWFVIAIGNNEVRKKIVNELGIAAHRYALLVHPDAVISPSAKIGFGTVIMPGAVVNANAYIGNHVIINTHAVIEHDNILSDFTHVSPRAALTGAVIVGEGTHIGAGVTIIPGISIGKWCIIGAGATVIRPVEHFQKVAGTPAKSIKRTFHQGTASPPNGWPNETEFYG